ncbi:unnamed protein product [Urochloa humidicola]
MKDPVSTPSLQMKGGPKKPQGRHISEQPLHPYEEERLRQCMRNSARLQQLGLPTMFPMTATVHVDKNKSAQRNIEESDSEYDPLRDVTQEDLLEDNAKGSKEKSRKKTTRQTSDLPPGGVKFRTRKRVFANMPSIRATKSQKGVPQPDASLAPSEVVVPNVSQASLTSEVLVPNVSQAAELVGNLAAIEDDGLNLLGENSCMNDDGARHNEDTFAQHEDNMADRVDGITHSDGHNLMTNEGEQEEWNHGVNMGHGLQRLTRARRSKLPSMVDGADGITHSGGQNMTNEGEQEVEEEEWNRGVNMGHGLQRLTRARRSRLPIVIAEGKIKPVVPVIAAKWATECNIIVRNHIPVLKHWKEYKKQREWIKIFKDNLSAKFDIDTRDPIIKKACIEMMKIAVRQQRYRLKQTFFDPFPLHLVMKTSPVKCMTDKQWIDLVESWKTPEKMEVCETNKDNRAKVQLHQTTGSQSYTVFVENIGDKYNDHEPDAFDLFKDCHYSKKMKGFTPAVQATILKWRASCLQLEKVKHPSLRIRL